MKEVQNSQCEQSGNQLELHFLDVGYGDCCVVIFPSRETMIIDCGTPVTSERIVCFLKQKEITCIDYLVITHFHDDHTGGAIDLMKDFSVKSIMVSPDIYSSDLEDLFAAVLEKNRTMFHVCKKGDRIYGRNNVSVRVLHPLTITDDHNENSLVLQVRYENISILLPGEISCLAEYGLITEYGDNLKSQVLKLGHHGWGLGNSHEWIDTVSPETVILSTGPSEYPSPDSALIEDLQRRNMVLYRTDKNSTIEIYSNGKEYSVKS